MTSKPPKPPVTSDEWSDDDAEPVIQPHVDPEVLKEDERRAERRKHRRRMSQEHIKRIKRKKRIRRTLIAIGVILAALIALGAWFVASALTVKSEMEAAVASAGQIQSQVTAGEADKAKTSIEDFSRHIDNTYSQTKLPIWKLATFIPYYGSDIKAARSAVLVLENVSNNALPKLASSAEALDFSQIGITNGVVELGDMESVAQSLTAANESVSEANVQLNSIGDVHIPQLTDALTKGKAKIKQLASLTDTATRMANVLPQMLNLDEASRTAGKTRTYLVIAQNNAELRATGGIPTSWSTLTVNGGKLSIGTFDTPPKSGTLSEQEALAALTTDERNLFSTKMATDHQDINFTPDFPRTAQLAQQIWKKAGRGTVDGVISVDPVFLQQLVKITGQVKLSDGTVLTGSNAAQVLLNQTYIDKSTQAEQDAFFTMAASEVFDHVLGNLGGKNKELLQTMQRMVSEGHFYVWSAHEDEQKSLSGTTISGALQSNPSQPQAGVYFNDATMGKMDWYLKREVASTYDKTYPSGAKQYTIHIKLTNTADKAHVNAAPDLLRGFDHDGNPRKGEIETVMYVYAPDEGRLVDWTQDFDQVTTHDGLTVGVKTLTLQPGESFETTVHVLASASADDNELILRQTPLVQ